MIVLQLWLIPPRLYNTNCAMGHPLLIPGLKEEIIKYKVRFAMEFFFHMAFIRLRKFSSILSLLNGL